MPSRVKQHGRKTNPKTDKVSMTYTVPPEMLQKEGLDVKKPVTARVEMELPKGILPKEQKEER